MFLKRTKNYFFKPHTPGEIKETQSNLFLFEIVYRNFFKVFKTKHQKETNFSSFYMHDKQS